MQNQFPLTVKRSIELLGLCLLMGLVSLGQNIIMPIVMAFFISIMLLPIYRKLMQWRFPEILAIFLPIIMVAIFIGSIVWFFSIQVGNLVNDFPQIKENVANHLHSLQEWFSSLTGIKISQQTEFLKAKSEDMLAMGGQAASGFAGQLSGVIVFVGLLPIYIYLILFYKDILLKFIFMWFRDEDHAKVKEVVYETEGIIKNYLIGLLIQVTYMTVLLGGLLVLFDIKHALLIGLIFAVLNLIPYVGALIGNIIGVVLTLTSSTELAPVITVLLVIAVVQFFDNNILMPKIVGSKVKINALFSIIGVVLGGTLAGISGMFLSIPIIAVLKIIFDRSEQFKKWGVLLGDERPQANPMTLIQFGNWGSKKKI